MEEDAAVDQICRIAIGILLERTTEGVRLLISQRPADVALGGSWEFPGGKCEAGESPEACLRREYREELGVEVEPIEALEPIEHHYPHARVRLHPFLCRRVVGEPAALQVADWRWVRPDELDSYTFPEANAPLLPLIRAAAERVAW